MSKINNQPGLLESAMEILRQAVSGHPFNNQAQLARLADEYNETEYKLNSQRQIIADLYLEAGIEKWGSEYNIVLGGGYIGVRSPYNLYAGEVRYKDLYTIFPFDNELCLCTISGYYLKQKFINTTNSNYFISLSDYGETLNIQDNATYYIIVDSYSAYYAPNKLTVVQTYGEAVYARDFLAEYIKGLK